MKQFSINEKLCTKCGACAQDCPTRVIEMTPFPVLEKEGCFECQHCLAICPTGAISILGRNPSDSLPLKGNLPSPEQMTTLIKGRRSVRNYQDADVAPEQLQQLLNTAWHAPTGVNTQTVQFTVISNRADMNRFRDTVYEELEQVLLAEEAEEGHAADFLAMSIPARKEYGTDLIFRGAPHLIIASADKNAPCANADTLIALSSFELLAQSMGIGTVWDGIMLRALRKMPSLTKRLGIPDDHEVGYIMAFGKPAIEYHRTVERGPANIHTVSWPE